jgi:nucleotide-binding universal stress UspA family protein
MFKHILVPLDGSELAETVLPVVSDLAKRFQATVILLHILEKDVPETVHGQRHLGQSNEARQYLSTLTGQLAASGILVEMEVHEARESNVAESISDHARELKADLVVLCAHGRGGLRDVIIGSIAQQVIQQETIPVLLIHSEQMPRAEAIAWKQIAVPLDGSSIHEAALPIAASIATKYEANIRLLSVVPTMETLRTKDAEAAIGRMLPSSTVAVMDFSAQELQKYLQKISQRMSGQGLTVSGIVLRGDPAPKIIETIETEGLELIVIATSGRRNFDAFWEESLTPKILSKSLIPALLLREARAEGSTPLD